MEEPRAGDKFGGYILEELISSSGESGWVWRVSRDTPQSGYNFAKYALKILNGRALAKPENIRAEAANWSQMSAHPNIASFIDIVFHDEENIGFLSLYYPDGSLRRLLKKTGIEVGEAVRLTIDILKGLQHSHDHNILHRDIKPENILLSSGVPCLIDFGLSRFIRAHMAMQMTASLGTPNYAPPEAWDHALHNLHNEADVWSVGVLLYELIEGALPFDASFDKIESVVKNDPPREFKKDIAPDLKRIILKALSKNPENRYASANEMRRALETYQNCQRTREAAEEDDWDVVVRRIALGDPKQEELLNLYCETFPDDGTVLTREQVREILIPNLPDRITKTDNIPLIATRNDELLGFIICTHYEETNMAFVSYFAVKPGVSPKFQTSRRLLDKLYQALHKIGCDYLFFESQIVGSTAARLHRFAELSRALGFEFRQFKIDYIGPKPHLDAREESLLFFAVGIRNDIGDRVSKEQMREFLDFMFVKVYGDIYRVESEEFRIHNEYLQQHVEKIAAAFPDEIETLVYVPGIKSSDLQPSLVSEVRLPKIASIQDVIEMTNDGISVRRVTEPNDHDLLPAYKVYEKWIPRNEQDEFSEIQRWLEENKAEKLRGNPKLDEYLLVCKTGARVCGFFYGQYYPSHRLFFVGYLVIDREDEDAKLIAAKELLCRLVAMVRQDHPDCEGIVFEIELDPKKDPRTLTAKERLFAVHARICGDIVLRRLDFEYQQPRLSLWDPASIEERQHLVYGRLGPPPLGRKCAKNEVLQVLYAVYNSWYADCFEDDPARDKEYRAYVRSLYNKVEAELADEVTLI